MRSFLLSLLQVGVDSAPEDEREHIRFTNWLSLISAATAFSYAVLFLILDWRVGVWQVWSFLFYPAPLLFGWLGRPAFGRKLYFLNATAHLSVFSMFWIGPASGTHYWLWVLPPFVYLSFPLRERLWIAGFTIAQFAGFFTGEFFSPLAGPLVSMSAEFDSLVAAICKTTAFAFIPLAVSLFALELNRARQARRRSVKETADLLANVEEGILLLDPQNRIGPEYSRRAAELLAVGSLAGCDFSELAARNPEEVERIREHLREMRTNRFMSASMLERLNPIAELVRRASGGDEERVLSFSFRRVWTLEQEERLLGEKALPGVAASGANLRSFLQREAPDRIMVVIADRTAERRLADELEERRQEEAERVHRLYQILQLPADSFSAFSREARAAVARLKSAFGEAGSAPLLSDSALQEECFRVTHSLKGAARALNLENVAGAAHRLEDQLDAMRSPDTRAGIDLERMRSALEELYAELKDGNEIFDRVMGIRSGLQSGRDPVEGLEQRLRNLLLRESTELGKELNLSFQKSEDAKIPQSLMDRLGMLVVQLAQNSLVHGLETPEERAVLGKPRPGRIAIRLFREGEGLALSCEDDGRGLNAAKIKAGAVRRGWITSEQAESMSRSEAFRLIFRSGLSTAEEVRESAGRGVGMDMVRAEVQALGGTIRIQSEEGRSTRFTLLFPRSTAADDAPDAPGPA